MTLMENVVFNKVISSQKGFASAPFVIDFEKEKLSFKLKKSKTAVFENIITIVFLFVFELFIFILINSLIDFRFGFILFFIFFLLHLIFLKYFNIIKLATNHILLFCFSDVFRIFKKNKKTILRNNIQNKKFTIINNNMFFKYNVFGDFSEAISRIYNKKISCSYVDEDNWLLVFEFKYLPKNGRIDVVYI